MTEEFVTIVKIRGKGAGKESMTEVPKSAWEKMQKDAANPKIKFTDANDWKQVTKKEAVSAMVEQPPKAKTPEEIMAEATEELSTTKEVVDSFPEVSKKKNK